MNTTKTLFIGGIADGRKHEVPDDVRYWKVTVPEGPPKPCPTPDVKCFTVKTETYRRETIRIRGMWDRDEDTHLFVSNSLTLGQAFSRLLDNYNPLP